MITAVATLPRDKAHMAPVLALLPEGGDIALVASYGDLKNAKRSGYKRIVLMQHGAGQSYAGDKRTARHPSYAGGDQNDEVGLFLVPNEHAANRWRERYPSASVAVIGCPRLDTLPKRSVAATVERASPVVAVSFHWEYTGIPELRNAFQHYRNAIIALSKHVTVLGHKHPKAPAGIVRFYEEHGIEFVEDFDDVCRRADVYACDNSSTLFEFASTGRPVVVLNRPDYRKHVNHGLRFWDAADVGVQVDRPEYLQLAVGLALDDRTPERREAALDLVYAYRTGGAQRAADAISEWARVAVAA